MEGQKWYTIKSSEKDQMSQQYFIARNKKYFKWAMSWENLFKSYANNKGAD